MPMGILPTPEELLGLAMHVYWCKLKECEICQLYNEAANLLQQAMEKYRQIED